MKHYFESITPAHLIGKPKISKLAPNYKKVAYFDSIDMLNSSIKKYFGCFDFVTSLDDHIGYLEEIAENFKIKLISENYEYCSFPSIIGTDKVYVTYRLEINS